MKKYEKILVIIVVALFVLLPVLPYYNASLIFVFATWFLALSYLFGGFWMFNTSEEKTGYLPITAGIIFAFGIVPIPFGIFLFSEDFEYLPLPNLLLFVFLAIYYLFNRKTGRMTSDYKKIFYRSFIILVVGSFFIYTPISSKFYRSVLKILHSGDSYLVNNIKMHDYSFKFEKAMQNEDCEKAIEFALEANKYGKLWLGIKHSEDEIIITKETFLSFLNSEINGIQFHNHWSLDDILHKPISKINETYADLYIAYKCKALSQLKNHQFHEATYSFQTAYYYLIIYNSEEKKWMIQKSMALNDLGQNYQLLKEYSLADSLYKLAIKKYKEVQNEEDLRLARIYSNQASSFSEQSYTGCAYTIYSKANKILLKDTSNSESISLLIKNYKAIGKDYLKDDDLDEGLDYLEKALSQQKKFQKQDCETILYYGIGLHRINQFQKADSVLQSCLDCYENSERVHNQIIADCHMVLGQNNIALAKYNEARNNLKKGMDITAKNFGTSNSRYANYLKVMAFLNKTTGEYKKAEQQLHTAIGIYRKDNGEQSKDLPAALMELADLEVKLSNLFSAKYHSDMSIEIASGITPLTSPRVTHLLNGSAYVNYALGKYSLADSMYNLTLDINITHNLILNHTTVSALGGLGLLATATKNYTFADSVFYQSLVLSQAIFSNDHPITANVYLNYGLLKIKQGEFSEAEEKIKQSLEINQMFFQKDHDVFGDIQVAFGDIANARGQKEKARLFYNTALEIYRKKFNTEHWKVKSLERKLI